MAKAKTGWTSTLSPMIRRAASGPPPAIEENGVLITRAREGDRRAYDRCIRDNTRLVISIAKDYRNKGLSFDELIQEGLIGLWESIKSGRFDVSRGYVLSTYAEYWIKHQILRALERYDERRPYRVPSVLYTDRRKINEMMHRYYQREGAYPSPQELVAYAEKNAESIPGLGFILELNEEYIAAIYEVGACRYVSLDAAVFNHQSSGERTTLDTIGDVNQSSDTLLDARRALKESLAIIKRVHELCATLDDRSRLVIRKRLGLNGETKEAFERIGKRLGVSGQRVYKMEERVMRMLSARTNLSKSKILSAFESIDALKKLAKDESEDVEDVDAEEDCAHDDSKIGYKTLCEHVILATGDPDSPRIVTAPLKVLEIRLNIKRARARQLLQEHVQRGLIRGFEPWSVIQIVANIQIPKRSARPECEIPILLHKKSSSKTLEDDDDGIEVVPDQ